MQVTPEQFLDFRSAKERNWGLWTYGARGDMLRELHAHVVALPAIAAFKTSANWMPFPAGRVGQDYVRNVRTVLS